MSDSAAASSPLSNDAPGWPPLAHAPALANGAAHVWLADVEQLKPVIAEYATLLSDDERQRVEAFRRPDDRARLTLSRGLLRYLMGAYLRVNAAELRFDAGPHGKPALAFPSSALTFNVSHAHLRILIAFAWEREVGVDVEHVEYESAERLAAADFFSVEERAALSMLPPEDRAEAFYRCWTRKEAYLKATGAGLSAPLDAFTLPLTPLPLGQPYPLTASSAQGGRRWELHDLPPIEGYAASLVTAHGSHATTAITCMRYAPQAR